MRLLIVDDEAPARRRLAALVEEIDPAGVEIVGEAGDGLTALALVRERRPDVLLLDIAMPEVDGFDVARHLPDPRPLVIFQTAYTQYALDAFDHDALDYVVKPVRRERLAQALDRARARLALATTLRGWDAGSLERLGSALGYQPARPARILVRHAAGHRLMPLRDVLRFSAAEGLVHAISRQNRSVVDYTLTELEARTAGAFVRTSRSDLVSLEHVRGIAGSGDGAAILTLSDGTRLRVSRRRAADVRRVLESGDGVR